MPDTMADQRPKVTLRGLFMLMRPRQWIKNSFVLGPLIFSGEFLQFEAVLSALVAVVLFCIASSATYIINDIHDIERDKLHPKKSLSRPLAAGIVTVPQALTLLVAFYVILGVSWFYAPMVISVIALYSVINLLYTFVLKHQPVIDIFTIAIGFVLRVYAGAMALTVPVSSWMFVTTLCLALYLAAVKRRQELSRSGAETRKVLEKYSIPLIDRYAEMSSVGALLFYSMFVMSTKPDLVITVPLVLFGLFRYWYVVEVLESGESPTDALLEDWQLMLTIILWVGCCTWALWPMAQV